MDYRRCYLQYFKEETEHFGVEILSWCLMTNHVHFIAVPCFSMQNIFDKQIQSPYTSDRRKQCVVKFMAHQIYYGIYVTMTLFFWIAAALVYFLGIETKGKSLDDIGAA